MKKLYTSLAFAISLLFIQPVIAQTTLTTASDFTVTDVDGVVHNLFNILNNGQHVCIDFFFDTCPPCIATSPMFRDTYSNFGCNQEDIFFIAIDVGDTDAQVIAYENSVLGGPPGYPSVSGLNGGGNAVVTSYGISAYPTYILIRPDKTILEQDMYPIANAATFTGYFANHGLTPKPCSTVGLNNELSDVAVSVYPNPAQSAIHINTGKEMSGYRILNLIGEVVVSNEQSSSIGNQATVDLSTLDAGMYIIEINIDNAKSRYRFVKQ